VEMKSDNRIAAGLSVVDFRPGKLTGEGHMAADSEPETYLDEYSRQRALPDGGLLECDPERLISRIEESNATTSR